MKLTGDAKFLFFTVMQAAIRMDDMGESKEKFVSFASEIWDTMKMNDKDKLSSILQESMMSDLNSFVKGSK